MLFQLTQNRIAVIASLAASLFIFAGCAQAPTPVITPQNLTSATQPYVCPNVVTISDANSNAVIYYKLNGTPVPNASGTIDYSTSGPFAINGSSNVTVTAMATAPQLTQSNYATADFSCPTAPPPPTFTPMPVNGEVCPINVTVNGTGAATYATTNGQTPSITNNIYNGSPLTVRAQETISAITCTAAQLCSAVATATYTCSAPVQHGYNTVGFTIQTGNDNADQNLDIEATFAGTSICLKATNNLPNGFSAPCAYSNAPTWNNGQQVTIPTTTLNSLVPAGAIPMMSISAKQGGCSLSCSNWDLQAITINLTDSTGFLPPITTTYGTFIGSGWNDNNCIARLKAPSNATTITFSLTGTPSMTYADGNSSERGQATTCKNNGG